MRKKSLIIFLLGLVILVLAISVNAQSLTDNIARGSGGIADIAISAFGPFFSALLGGSPYYLFEQILLFFIITSIVYMTVKQMPVFQDNGAIILIITLSVSLLSTRFFMISDFLIETVLLPYTVLGVTLAAFLPLIIGFFFIHQFHSSVIRKTFWIFFLVVFIGMWDLRYQEVGGISWMYFWSAVISLAFFLFDGTIRRAMIKEQMKTVGVDNAQKFAVEIRKELKELEENKKDGLVPEAYYKRTKRRLNKQLESVLKF